MDGVQHNHSRRGGRVRLNRPLKVAKFGGTSVGEAERLLRVVEIVQNSAARHQVIVIASAASGITDQLVSAWDTFEQGFDEPSFIQALIDRHVSLAMGVLCTETLEEYKPILLHNINALQSVFAKMREAGQQPAFRDSVLAAGERLSVPLVSLALKDVGLNSIAVDAASLISTDDTYGEAVVDLESSFRQIRNWYKRITLNTIPVVTGFIGSTIDGQTTTLGRGGSDYSAAILASALKASVMERWTDVDGIYTEDPRQNKDAKRLASIILEEAWAWNQAGRLGMHRKALDPLVAVGIPVHVRSTAAPDRFGTLIVPSGKEQHLNAVAL